MTKNKNILIVVVIILILAGAFVYWKKDYFKPKAPAQSPSNNSSQSVLELAKQLPIKTFYISGTVTQVSTTSVTFDANLGGSQSKVSVAAQFTKTTPIYNEIKTKTKTTASALKVGQVINVSTATYPYDQAQFAAAEINILK